MKGKIFKIAIALMILVFLSSPVAGDRITIEGKEAYYGAPLKDISDVDIEIPKFAVATELKKPEVTQEECVDCHKEDADVFEDTIHNTKSDNEDENVYCVDCHVAGDSYFTTCDKDIINPKALVIQRQSLSCNSECHDQVTEIQEDSMYEITACDYCHEVRDMTEDNRLGHKKPMEEICTSCHTTTFGDQNAIPAIHNVIQYMVPDISENEDLEVEDAERPPLCIDCHMFSGVDEEGKNTFTHAFGFNEDTPSLTCGQDGCHPDMDDERSNEWIAQWEKGFEEPPHPEEPEGIKNPLVFAFFVLAVGIILFWKYY